MMNATRRGIARLVTTTGLTSMMLVALLLSCSPPSDPPDDVDFFAVRLTHVQSSDGSGGWRDHPVDGLRGDPLPYATPAKISLEISPQSQRQTFRGYVQLDLVPGKVTSVSSTTTAVTRTGVYVSGDEPIEAEIQVEGAFGDARLLVEDVGHVPGPPQKARCDDGLDNDGDGSIDFPNDPGCFLRNDDSEDGGSHAVGVSETIYFANPRLSDVQGCDLVPSLSNQAVDVDRGAIYVTAVQVKGFYVSDRSFVLGGCDPQSGCCEGGRYAHMYAFNFNTPHGMRVCDRLEKVGGIVADFYGFTEFNFPSWEMYDLDDTEPGTQVMRLEPHEITPEDCPLEEINFELSADLIPNRRLMETYESALVYVTDAVLPDEWINCDYNNNGWVAYNSSNDELTSVEEVNVPPEYCTPDSEGMCSEAECNNTCLARSCSELSNYYEYGQYPVFVDGVSILVVTNSGAPEFNPRANRGATISRIGGVLKEFAPLDTPWIIEPRCRQDIYIAGDSSYPDVPIYQRCVPSEETGDYEDPY